MARKSNSPADWEKYKGAKYYVTNLIKKSKRRYVQESIDDDKGNPKGLWKALKSPTKTQKSNKITELKRENGTAETDAIVMATMLNEFFGNVAQELHNAAPLTHKPV
jgi:hypothetical protein